MEKQVQDIRTMEREKLVSLVMSAMFIALVYIFTAFVNVRLPIGGSGGLIHLGNVPLFIAATFFGKKAGMIAGGIGMGLFDLLSGWTAWAPFTLIIVGAMGFTFALIIGKKNRLKRFVIAIFVVLVIKIVGYYIAEVLLYRNWVTPVMSIPGNVLQILVAGIITMPVILGSNQVTNRRNGG